MFSGHLVIIIRLGGKTGLEYVTFAVIILSKAFRTVGLGGMWTLDGGVEE